MTDITLHKLDELFVRIEADKGILFEMQEHFSYFVDGYKFTPQFKSGIWDGKIRLLNMSRRSIYSGLINDIKKFCEKYNYSLTISDELKPLNFIQDLKTFVKTIPEISELTPYDYQMEAFIGAIVENKSLVLSPTASGKSLMIYLIIRFLLKHIQGNILMVVPSISLVEQVVGDFKDYDPDDNFDIQCHKIRSGLPKIPEKTYTINFEDSSIRLRSSQVVKTGNRGDVYACDLKIDDVVSDVWLKKFLKC